MIERKNIFMIGIGGSGMSALAKYYSLNDKNISGYDRSKSATTQELEEINIDINYEQKQIPEGLKNADLIVYTIAIRDDDPFFLYAKKNNIKTLTYGEAIGELTKKYKTITVSGTHGKTTTTGILGYLLKKHGINPHIIVGSPYEFMSHGNYNKGDTDILILEACEYKGTFLNYHTELSIILNIDHDHHDYFHTQESYNNIFIEYTNNTINNGGYVICDKKSSPLIRHNQVYPQDNLSYPIIGDHNKSNASAAITAIQKTFPNLELNFNSLKDFKFASRRLEKLSDNHNFYTDYAHHPDEIKMTINTIKEIYPHSKINLIFQPHLLNRTENLLNEFTFELKRADNVLIPNIYEARHKMNLELNSNLSNKLAKKIGDNAKYTNGYSNLKNILLSTYKDYDVNIFMGAGDIDNFARDFVKQI